MTVAATALACPPGDRFALGRLLVTRGAERAIDAAGEDPFVFLSRHASGDWGEVSEEERWVNERGIERGLRILSAHQTSQGVPLWIVTAGDRSATTILLAPEGLASSPCIHPAPAGRGDNEQMGSVICPDCGAKDFRHIARVELLRRVVGFDQVGTLLVEELPVAEVGEGPFCGRLLCAACDAELDLPAEVSFL